MDEFRELNAPAEVVAPRLLGCELHMQMTNHTLAGRIVETEAYDQADAASHSYRGETERTRVMFGPAGFLYVYFTYGMHYCCNVVVGPAGHGAAVLIRAIEPLAGHDVMAENRHGRAGHELTNGPAKLCQAFGINKQLNGHDLLKEPLTLTMRAPLDRQDIVQTTRVGISEARDVPWRFYIRDNPFVSRLV